MTDKLEHYRSLQRRLWLVRMAGDSAPHETPEDGLLDEMDGVWLQLSDAEREKLRAEGPVCWPLEAAVDPPQLPAGSPSAAPAPWAYEGFQSPSATVPEMDKPA